MPEVNSKKKSTQKTEKSVNLKIKSKILSFKRDCESNIVAIFYKQPSLMYEIDLTLEDFSHNAWKVYFTIANDIIVKEQLGKLDDITVGIYLDKHPKLKAKFEEYGGYSTIAKASEYVHEENLNGYIGELKKWKTVLKLHQKGFPITEEEISEFEDMALEEIYERYELLLNDSFVNVDTKLKAYNACDKIYDLIDELDKGDEVGLPFYNSDLLTEEIGGLNLGHIYGIGANSGVGKSTAILNLIAPSIIEQDETMVMFINEEDEKKVRKELLIWVANNIFNFDIQKKDLRKGGFSDELKEKLHKCAEWLEGKKEKQNILVVPLERYSANIVVKLIRKYSAMGIKYFVLDTLKESFDEMNTETYKSMTRDMVKLYDVIKPKSKNVCLVVTYQLGKASIKMRYYTNNEIGMGKGIVDVMSCNIMMRRPFKDEFADEKSQIEAECIDGKKRISRKLDKEKNYMIFFIPKNRFGSADTVQIIAEYDLSKNKYKDLGTTTIQQDF